MMDEIHLGFTNSFTFKWAGLYEFLCQCSSGTAILAVFLHGLEARATN
jgi:hypothetical protein